VILNDGQEYLIGFVWFCVVLNYYRYTGYRTDQMNDGYSGAQEGFMSLLCFMECALLGSFAAILGAHRSEILEKGEDPNEEDYQTPYVQS
jgi:hypothetical protein